MYGCSSILSAHLRNLANLLPKSNLEYRIVLLLTELQIPTGCKGYEYLKTAISVFYQNPTQFITKSLYPAVVHSCNSQANTAQIERNIRYALKTAWEHRDIAAWDAYFGEECHCPSNGEFITCIVRALQAWKVYTLVSQK